MDHTSGERIKNEGKFNQRARFVPKSLQGDFRVLEGGGKSKRIKS